MNMQSKKSPWARIQIGEKILQINNSIIQQSKLNILPTLVGVGGKTILPNLVGFGSSYQI